MPVFKELRINVEFYQLSDGLRIDAEEIRDKTSIGETILFVINYFGFPADWELVNTLKKELGLFIIEDNAHSPFSKYRDTNLGSLGDMSFNSLRKFLPLLSGSELCIKNTDENEFYGERTRRPSTEEIIYSLRHLKPSLIKKSKKNISTDEDFDLKCSSIDYLSNLLVNKDYFNKAVITEKRIKNYKFWKDYLKNQDLEYFDDLVLNKNICPYVFPCIAQDEKHIKTIIEWGFANGINIINWPKLPNLTGFTLSSRKLKNVVFYPVNHQYDIEKLL